MPKGTVHCIPPDSPLFSFSGSPVRSSENSLKAEVSANRMFHVEHYQNAGPPSATHGIGGKTESQPPLFWSDCTLVRDKRTSVLRRETPPVPAPILTEVPVCRMLGKGSLPTQQRKPRC